MSILHVGCDMARTLNGDRHNSVRWGVRRGPDLSAPHRDGDVASEDGPADFGCTWAVESQAGARARDVSRACDRADDPSVQGGEIGVDQVQGELTRLAGLASAADK